jgi:hypothetical protein
VDGLRFTILVMKNILPILLLSATTSFGAAQQQPDADAGAPADRFGAKAFDPTQNVLDLVRAAVKRLDDLREQAEKFQERINLLENKRLDDLRAGESRRVDEEAKMRADFEIAMAVKEAGRLDSIRQVDRDDVSKTAAQVNVATSTLASRTTDLQTTLAKAVTDAAAATEARFSQFQSETNKRLSSLEAGSSERQGKSTVVDPQMEQLRASVEKLAAAKSEGQGQWTLLSTEIAVGILVYRKSSQNGKLLRGAK